ncbi:MAG: 2-amino-4-hydroxy-6-hydroxymethyldihydropteridine diphosphokinase [Nitrospinae bacterium]|nr:2-amino-4-hydroxy-6-hydroxymethyldihydropteridine diphosphokinase [Nitrospinota bacterium]
MTTVYLSLGSNVGDPIDNLITAIGLIIETDGIAPAGLGSFYETEPLENTRQHWFVNTAVGVETDHDPQTLFLLFKQIERDMGREPGERNAPRLIDIDIVFYGDRIVTTPDLTIPHPKAALRRFVLAPLNDIDPGIRHPGLGLTVGELLAACSVEGQEIRKAGP